jgi:hypothetical protein
MSRKYPIMDRKYHCFTYGYDSIFCGEDIVLCTGTRYQLNLVNCQACLEHPKVVHYMNVLHIACEGNVDTFLEWLGKEGSEK